jgi:hypothetical protein
MTQRQPIDMSRVNYGLEAKGSASVNIHHNVLADKRGHIATAKRNHLDAGFHTSCSELKPTCEFSACEIVGLIDC